MRQSKESPEQKISQLEVELAAAKNIAEAARLALSFCHDMRPYLAFMTNIVFLAKSQSRDPDIVTNYLTLVEENLESLTKQSDRLMDMVFQKDTWREPK